MLVCSHGHDSRSIADTEAVATRGTRAARTASAGGGERVGGTNSALMGGPILLTSRPWLDRSTLSYEDELRLIGVRERHLAEGRTVWTDGADVDNLQLRASTKTRDGSKTL